LEPSYSMLFDYILLLAAHGACLQQGYPSSTSSLFGRVNTGIYAVKLLRTFYLSFWMMLSRTLRRARVVKVVVE
jgi:hypothetical protein